MKIEAVLLDLGNVLVHHDNDLLFRRMAERFRTTAPEIKSRLDGGLWEAVNRGRFSGDSLRRELIARLGGDISSEEWIPLWNSHFNLYRPMISLVEELVGRVKLVLVSNTHDQHVSFLRPLLPVLEKFDGLVLSCAEGVLKPEPEIFRRALQIAGVTPEKAVFFDDVPAYVEAARNQGINGFVFTTAEEARKVLVQLGVIPAAA